MVSILDIDPDGDEQAVGKQLQDLARDFLSAGEEAPLDPARLVTYAAEAVPHARDCGLTLVRGEQAPRTLAASSDLAEHVDALQYDTGEGPCLEAIADNDITRANDLEHDDRWPRFRSRLIDETPVRSMFGVRILLGGPDRGALNFYAIEPHAFAELDLGIGAVLSTLASLSLRSTYEQQRATNLETALDSNRQIGMAIGVLMSSRLLTKQQAFEELRAASQHLHRKLRDVALDVTETGALPDITRPQR